MNALILAAGLGTRLRPLTDTMPKALVPVAGKPLLQHLIEKLKACGCCQIVVNVHHFAEQIMEFLTAHQNFGIDIQISDERRQLLDTGGAVKKALPLFCNADPVLVHNVDVLNNISLDSFYQQNAHLGDATLLVSQRATSRYLLADADHRLIGWKNVKTGETKGQQDGMAYAFSGIHIFSPALLPLMNEWGDCFSIIDFYLHACTTHRILLQPSSSLQMLDVGKIDSISIAESFISRLHD
jgi:NDP-sugar pyrophosphorylase family protein